MKLETPPKILNKEKYRERVKQVGQEKVKDKEREKTVESIAAVSSKQLGYPLAQDVSHDGVVEMVRLAIVFNRVSYVEIEMGPFWDGDPWTEHISKENVLEVLNEQWLSASSLTFYIRALVSFRTGRGKTFTKMAYNTFKCTNIECPKQLPNDGIFCGHYVGCFIEDVLCSGETSISVNFTRSNRLMCYSHKKMLRFRDNWARFFYNRYLKGKLLNM
ncbi:uncharacterized protein LOC141704410 isoform X1 [Apium graveolens]|uniref:uncharacterized protein LOC141704410 isoform X1 n=1 Tax=Apium graveolens TaxID=4045 RepID=UPI003D795CA0